MKNPQISIIIPCFNYGTYLYHCINSIITSDFTGEKEIIVVDDGSTDNTKEVVSKFENIIYIYQDNAGLSAARNTGLQNSCGKYILFLDADDLLFPHTISSQVQFLDNHPEVDIVVCQNIEALSMTADGPLVPIGSWPLVRKPIAPHFCHFNIAPSHAFLVRRHQAFHEMLFDTQLRACEDYDFWFRCLISGMRFSTNTMTQVVYRRHAESMSSKKANQLRHDSILHLRIFDQIKQNDFIQKDYRSWIAHAAGCLVTVHRLMSLQTEKPNELIDLCSQSIREFAKKITQKRTNEIDEIADYYANKALLHVHWLSFLKDQRLDQIGTILTRLLPHLPNNQAALAKREKQLHSQVHYPPPMVPPPSVHLSESKRILLGSDFFWPSFGGCENFLADLGKQLSLYGYEVHVVTRKLESRDQFFYEGIHIIQFDCTGRFRDNAFGPEYERYQNFLLYSQYKAAIIIGQPDSWLHAPLLTSTPPFPIHLIPIINPELVNDWNSLNHHGLVAAVLQRAHGCISLTQSGLDASYLRTVGVEPFFIPHAITPFPPQPGFRKRHGLKTDLPLLVHVGNFWPVKNQLALVTTMQSSPGQWQLALIGAALPWPQEKQYYDAVVAAAAQDPRIHLLGPLPPEEADAAIAEADLLLLPSKAECRPLVILQAMHHGTPWIATPQCNSVHEDAGGIICPLPQFPSVVATLLSQPALRQALGAIGKQLWQQCFTWENVLPLFVEIIERGKPQSPMAIPEEISRANLHFSQKVRSLSQL